ncbi:hypothetical protein OLX02_13720 [Novosphingobium sp. KCTC 2891]|uniref:hypothetical protein n=1 Tax=Novosphingobium sp. KCTC 2891 TaxID=2989730 RepID=UPI002222E175|nr:hypothetical protein [Novosphingobium sp. KCTC 2891]MCW1383877.1 hypothetical protein [Novosphingobium sp. KCTC 2891]
MMRKLTPAPLLALALAACSGEPQAPAPEASGTASEAAAASSEAPASASAAPAESDASRPDVSDAASPAPAASTEASIPMAARGRWGLVPADCTSTRGEAKGLLVVDAASLKFYESVGKLASVKERSDTRIRAAFAFSGEGMTWQRDEVLEVQDGGKTLVRREYGADAMPGPLKYTICG